MTGSPIFSVNFTKSKIPANLNYHMSIKKSLSTEAEKGQSKNILQIPKNISNQNIFFKITVEKFDKCKTLLQILRKLVDPEITFSIIRKYFANP